MKHAYYFHYEDDGWILVLSTLDEPGYAPVHTAPRFATEDEARAAANERNRQLGLTDQEAARIIASSMRAQNTRRGT